MALSVNRFAVSRGNKQQACSGAQTGLLLGAGKTVFDGADDLRAHLQAEAAKLGGDAVIVRSESTDTEFILTGTARIKSDIRRAVGEVIVFDG